MPLSSDVASSLAGVYRLLDLVGRGGMAEAYTAHDIRHDRTFASKFLDDAKHDRTDAERFLREVKVAARLNHPHILPVFDSGEAQGRLYYVMPFVGANPSATDLAAQRPALVRSLRGLIQEWEKSIDEEQKAMKKAG